MSQHETFDYCPRCGADRLEAHGVKAQHCQSCGFTYYHNPSAAVALFVRDRRGRLLVATRGKEPAKGTLDLPGGFVDKGETGEEAAQRELYEESGLQLPTEQFVYAFSLPNSYLYSGFLVPTLDLFYTVQLPSEMPAVRAMDDVAQLSWFAPAEIDPSRFGLISIRQGIARYLSSLAD
ncbi:NUDIX domain-containing protein [uncultured Porphyromonas sp.]|uniref:NUDIX domain-containing protein n=1 Tax=uncultured Porphyromonas sp. TaxID=159274 RepID=UPI002603083C|nr:NUDIX domain-containing protein [uncultured Porphyromonas sp.]